MPSQMFLKLFSHVVHFCAKHRSVSDLHYIFSNFSCVIFSLKLKLQGMAHSTYVMWSFNELRLTR